MTTQTTRFAGMAPPLSRIARIARITPGGRLARLAVLVAAIVALLPAPSPAQAPQPPSTTSPASASAQATPQKPATAKPTPDADGILFIPAARTAEGFAKGETLVETATYKVLTSRRDGTGVAEVHTRDTDIFYMLEGTASIVIGGTVVDGKPTAPDEIRGARLEGGKPRTLAKGDVLIVPKGVPHWFRDVQGPMLCYIVKITSPAGAR